MYLLGIVVPLSAIHFQYTFWNITSVQHTTALKKASTQAQKENVGQYDIFSLIFNLLFFVCFHCSHKLNSELFAVHFGDIEKHLSVKLSSTLKPGYMHLSASPCLTRMNTVKYNTHSPHLPRDW